MIRCSAVFIAIYFCVGMAAAAEFVLSAPPTESREQSLELYQPIADYLSTVSGEEVVYEYPGSWPTYMKNMQQSKYDFVLDSPHFISWRVENIEHRLLVGLAENLIYVVVVVDDRSDQTLTDLQGKSACSAPVPNLDALTLMDQYESSWIQPDIVVVQGFEERFSGLLNGQCYAAVLPKRVYEKFANTTDPRNTRIVFESQELPHYGLSVSPRIDQKLYEKLRPALLSRAADPAFREISNLYAIGEYDGSRRVSGDKERYQGYAYLLTEFWGF